MYFELEYRNILIDIIHFLRDLTNACRRVGPLQWTCTSINEKLHGPCPSAFQPLQKATTWMASPPHPNPVGSLSHK
jgi:hypothetical protein